MAFLDRDKRVVVADATKGTLLCTFTILGKTTNSRKLALSPDGRWLSISSQTRRGVEIYDFTAGKIRYTLPEREGTVYWLAWDPSDEGRLAVARHNGDIALWDLSKIDQRLTDLGLGFKTSPTE